MADTCCYLFLFLRVIAISMHELICVVLYTNYQLLLEIFAPIVCSLLRFSAVLLLSFCFLLLLCSFRFFLLRRRMQNYFDVWYRTTTYIFSARSFLLPHSSSNCAYGYYFCRLLAFATLLPRHASSIPAASSSRDN